MIESITTKPIKVAQVMGKMVGGGLEAVVMNYYRHIDRNRVQFDFLVDADSTFVPIKEIESLGGRVIEVPPYQRQPQNMNKLESLFRSERYRIVHSHMNSLTVFPLRAAKKAEIPIRIAHSHSTWGKGEYKRNMLKAVLRTQANRYPTHRMACGKLAGEWLFGPGADFWIMPNAIDLDKFSYSSAKRLEARNQLGIEDNAFVILHMGRFVTQKNHSFLIEIFESVSQRCADAILILAGEGPLEEEIVNKTKQLGISRSVRFLGQRNDPDFLYCAADCFCLPSLYEGLPVVGVEAQAAGLPIVMSTDVSSEALITSRAKAIPRSSDADYWAEVICGIKSDSRTSLLSRDDCIAIQQYDIVTQSAWLTKLYLELAGETVI